MYDSSSLGHLNRGEAETGQCFIFAEKLDTRTGTAIPRIFPNSTLVNFWCCHFLDEQVRCGCRTCSRLVSESGSCADWEENQKANLSLPVSWHLGWETRRAKLPSPHCKNRNLFLLMFQFMLNTLQ